jgi:hypothetical protein
MPASRAACWAPRSPRSASHCRNSWKRTSSAWALAKRATSALSGSRSSAGQSRQCQRPAANCSACSASKRACCSKAVPPLFTNSRNSRDSASRRCVPKWPYRARSSRCRALAAAGQSTKGSASRRRRSASSPSSAHTCCTSASPNTGSGSAWTLLRNSRLDGAYGLKRCTSAPNRACTGLIASASAPPRAQLRANSVRAPKSPTPKSPARRRAYSCAATPHSRRGAMSPRDRQCAGATAKVSASSPTCRR